MSIDKSNKIIPYSLSIKDACLYTGMSRCKIFELIKNGALKAHYVYGVSKNPNAKKKKIVLRRDELESYVDSTKMDTVDVSVVLEEL